jgi:hypothetical protein
VPGPIKITTFGWPRKPRPALTGPARAGVRFTGSERKNARGADRTKDGTANLNRWLYSKIRLALTTDHWAIQSVAPVERAEPRPITIRSRRTTNGRGCNFRMPSAARIRHCFARGDTRFGRHLPTAAADADDLHGRGLDDSDRHLLVELAERVRASATGVKGGMWGSLCHRPGNTEHEGQGSWGRAMFKPDAMVPPALVAILRCTASLGNNVRTPPPRRDVVVLHLGVRSAG